MCTGMGVNRRTSDAVGAEVWGTRVPKILEKLRKELGRALINAPASTNCEVIQGELGWLPIKANWDIARLMYWH